MPFDRDDFSPDEDDCDDNSEFEDEDSNSDDEIPKFVIMELQEASNGLGQKFWVVRANPIERHGTQNFGFTTFVPYINNDTQTFLFPFRMEKYLFYMANKQKAISIDISNCDFCDLDGNIVSIIKDIRDYESYEEFYNLPDECQRCKLQNPRCHNCEYMSCCYECEYLNHCNS